MVLNQVAVNTQLSIFSKNIDLGIADVQKYSNALEMAGGSAEGMKSFFALLSKSATDIQYGGTSPLIQYLQHLNVDLVDSSTGKLRKLTDVFDDLHRKVQGRDRATEYNLAKSFGISEDVLNLMFKTNKEYDELLKNGSKNAAITKDQAEQYEKAQAQIAILNQQMNKLASDLTLMLYPAIISIGTAFTKAWEKAGNFGSLLGEALFNWLHPDKENSKNFAPKNTKSSSISTSSQSAVNQASPSSGKTDPVKFFMDKGWTKEQAAGIIANLQSESGMSPSAIGDNGQAYGVAQWHPDRQARFKKFSGKDIRGSSLEDQLAFIHSELNNEEKKAGDLLKASTTAKRAADVFSRYYERPAATEAEAAKRGELAQRLYAGVPGATNMAANARSANVGNNVSNRSVEASIGEVKIYTAATDAAGIAASMKPAMNYLLVSQADYGLVP
jgi:hypothetical protein